MNRFPHFMVAAVLILAAADTFAATRYVTDVLRVSVRSDAGDEYRIIEVVESGTRLETLQSEGEWVEVRTPEGNTGWIRSQYLVEEPVSAERLETARAELEDARERIEELEDSLAQEESETESAQERIESLTADNERLESRIADAERGLDLHDENERLKNNLTSLMRRSEEFREEIRRLEDRDRKEWFVIGAGVLLGGILFGIIVTLIPWRGRRNRMF